MVTIILALIVGAVVGIGGLFGCAWISDQWRRRKMVSYMDQSKAERLLYDRAVRGLVDARDEGLHYQFGYELCLSSLFSEDYKERVSAKAEHEWINKKYPVRKEA